MSKLWSKLLRDLVEDLDLNTPLEKYWDQLSDRWEPDRPGGHVVILALGDITVDGDVFLHGTPIKCPLCGKSDNWEIEGDYKTKEIRVFVCEHKTKDLEKLGLLFWIPCRVVATVPAGKVWDFWPIDEGET